MGLIVAWGGAARLIIRYAYVRLRMAPYGPGMPMLHWPPGFPEVVVGSELPYVRYRFGCFSEEESVRAVQVHG